MLMLWLNAYLMVRRRQIDTAKHPSLAQLIQQVGNPGNREHIELSLLIQASEVYAHPKFPSFLPDEQDGCAVR